MAVSILGYTGYGLAGSAAGMSLTLDSTSSSSMASLVSRTYGVTVSGGTSPFTYAWALVDPYGNNVASTLMSAPTSTSGTYSPYWAPGVWVEAVTVTDVLSNTAVAYRTIIQENVMNYSIYSDWMPTSQENPPSPVTANTVVVV